jgi:hypothetical protein
MLDDDAAWVEARERVRRKGLRQQIRPSILLDQVRGFQIARGNRQVTTTRSAPQPVGGGAPP